MIRLVLVLAGLSLTAFGHAQSRGDTLFFSETMELVKAGEEAHFLGVRYPLNQKTDSILFYTLDGTLYSNQVQQKNKKNGRCYWYHENGVLSQSGQFEKNKPVGEHSFYDVSGVMVYADIYAKNHKKVAQYIYTESGKKVFTEAPQLSRFGHYRNANKSFAAMSKFIADSLVKPLVVEELAEPVVVVDFLISPTGQMEEIEMTYTADARLNQSVYDLMAKMPLWQPAVFNHVNVYSRLSITIVF